MRRAPFPPLVAGADALSERPIATEALRRRMAEVYGVAPACVLPIRDVAHGVELAMRWAGVRGIGAIDGALSEDLRRLARCYRLRHATGGVIVVAAPDAKPPNNAAPPVLTLIDESLIELSGAETLSARACELPNMVVLRSLSFAYGLAGAPCGAAIGSAALIGELESLLEPWPLSTPTITLALAALDPSRMPLTQARWQTVRAERARVTALLAEAEGVLEARMGGGPHVLVRASDTATIRAAMAAFALDAEELADGIIQLAVGSPEYNERLLGAFGIAAQTHISRRAEIVRDTKETRIVAAVDLDSTSQARIDTGIGFYDHMLSQVALHGGFSLTLTCTGDLHIDAHHTIEDCAIALGQALDKALGDRRGIGRFGFLLPMDETEAQVSIDLGGRPFSVFHGAFAAPLLGAYPTEMTAHVFRSLAETMRAAIHVSVNGDNDHHKTEACFKAFGRALRDAIKKHGEEAPSTKGVL